MMEQATFVDLILPLSLFGTLTYQVPEALVPQLQPGKRAIVPLGRQKRYAAIIKNIHSQAPGFRTRFLIEILDEHPVVRPYQLEFWDWMAQYYMAKPGEVMMAALPAGLKINSESVFRLHQGLQPDQLNTSDDEFLILEALQVQEQLNMQEIIEITGSKNVMPTLKHMLDQQWITAEEQMVRSYFPKTIRMLGLAPKYQNEQQVILFMDKLGNRAKKQYELIEVFLQMKQEHMQDYFPKADLMRRSASSPAPLQGLIRKGFFVEFDEEVSRLQKRVARKTVSEIQLNHPQQKALDKARQAMTQSMPLLIHGVTGSGKTEVYLKLIHEQLNQGRQILYLLPEIALTTQMIQRISAYFGDQVAVYHSRHSSHEKTEIWKQLLQPDALIRIVIGPRSALFLPFEKLGLIIVDEEHDPSYKQYDPAPRYHARDAALKLGKQLNIGVVMGSATPALETYIQAKSGKYALAEISQRYLETPLPEVIFIDLRHDKRRRMMRGHLSKTLVEAIREQLEQERQVIIFQNRRGYAPSLQCQACGEMLMCINCDVSLSYHQYDNQLKCHYCGFAQGLPSQCPTCQKHELQLKNFGTEKLEKEIIQIFPDSKVKRMDYDTTRGKNAFDQIIQSFSDGETHILIGTQMVTKGLDFGGVGLVAVPDADGLLGFPDFRAEERAFQLLMQAGGRSGRKNRRGKVYIQTHRPSYPVFKAIQQYQSNAFYARAARERQSYHYPPYYRIIELRLKHRNKKLLSLQGDQLKQYLEKLEGAEILGPAAPVVGRLRNMYLLNFMLKYARNEPHVSFKAKLNTKIEAFKKDKNPKGLIIIVDVDPY